MSADGASPIRVTGINHIGLAPSDPDKARWFFKDVLGLEFLAEQLVAAQKTNTIMFDSRSALTGPDGSSPRLEVLEPQDGTDGPIAKFLAKKGSGIHHIALTVASIDAALDQCKRLDVRMIDESPRDGAHDTKIAFVHPQTTGGVLCELVEDPHAG